MSDPKDDLTADEVANTNYSAYQDDVLDGQLADDADLADELVTNDAVAGETVFPGSGEGNYGETGGAPDEGEPTYARNDLDGDDIDLDESP